MKRNFVLTVGFFALCLALSRCGLKGEGGSEKCQPTHVGNSMTISMSQISGNSYRVELCTDMTSSNSYTVYGGIDSNSVSASQITVANVRNPPHILGARSAGSVFQVELNSSDVWFAIYLDDGSGNYATTTLLVSGKIPGR